VNLNKVKLSDIVEKTDIIVYFDGALRCFQPFDGDLDKRYVKLVRDEYKRAADENELQIHKKIRKKARELGILKDVSIEMLRRCFEDDLSILNSEGVIITNYEYDFSRIAGLMLKLGMEGENFEFITPKTHLKKYERKITVWKRLF
jgi:hypothetical protein